MKKILFLLLLVFTSHSVLAEKKLLIVDPNNIFPKVKLETTLGNIIIELDRVKAPLTVDNFLRYVVKGEYNNTIFHRVVPGFVVQGGGYDKDFTTLKTDQPIANESGNGLKNQYGTVAMARLNKPHSATRQFFFNVGDNKSLDSGSRWGYAVFGAIVEGEEVLTKMAAAETIFHEQQNWPDVPKEPIVLIKATLLPAE